MIMCYKYEGMYITARCLYSKHEQSTYTCSYTTYFILFSGKIYLTNIYGIYRNVYSSYMLNMHS